MSASPDELPQAVGPAVNKPYVEPISFMSGETLGDDNFHLVAEFTCAAPGQEEKPYERDVSEWLKNPGRGGAREAVRLGQTEVRLFFIPPPTDLRLPDGLRCHLSSLLGSRSG